MGQPIGDDLEEAEGAGDVLQHVVTEIHDGDVVAEQLACHRRDDDLAAVCRGADPRPDRQVDPEVVPAFGDLRLSGVEPHAHPYRIIEAGESSLSPDRGRDGFARARECREEGVALRVDLDAAVCGDDTAECPPMRLEHVAVAVAVRCCELGRALDVGEQQRHGATRECALGFHCGRVELRILVEDPPLQLAQIPTRLDA